MCTTKRKSRSRLASSSTFCRPKPRTGFARSWAIRARVRTGVRYLQGNAVWRRRGIQPPACSIQLREMAASARLNADCWRLSALSEQSEVHFQRHGDADWLAVFLAGFEE